MPTSIAVYRWNLYFIDFKLSSIMKISKSYGTSRTVMRSNLNYLYQLKVATSDLHQSIDNHPCARQNGDCSHFCFAVPSSQDQYALTRHCGCPYGQKLDSNMATCITNSDEPIVNSCLAPNFFKCSNDKCILNRARCDGVNDCLDFSDEQNCPTYHCNQDQFKCRNGTCIPSNKRCDGKYDCSDFSDEMRCPQTTCYSNQFKCTNGSCIPSSWKW